MNKRGVLMIFNDSGIWIVAVLCYAIAIYAFTGKKPVHFWAGHKIRQYTIKNVKLYNFFMASCGFFLLCILVLVHIMHILMISVGYIFCIRYL